MRQLDDSLFSRVRHAQPVLRGAHLAPLPAWMRWTMPFVPRIRHRAAALAALALLTACGAAPSEFLLCGDGQ